MVLMWTNDNRTESLVLDNLDKMIKPGKERQDPIIVYLTDADGKNRSIKAEFKPKKFKKLEAVKHRLRENKAKYTKINDGIPLY